MNDMGDCVHMRVWVCGYLLHSKVVPITGCQCELMCVFVGLHLFLVLWTSHSINFFLPNFPPQHFNMSTVTQYPCAMHAWLLE